MKRARQHIAVSIIGAGKVGSTLAVLLHRAGYPIVSVISRKRASAQKLAGMVHCKQFSSSLSALSPRTQFLLIAAPENAFASIIEGIPAKLQPKNLYIAHTSGVESSEIFDALSAKGAHAFSLHPLQSFPKHIPLPVQIEKMRGVVFGFEGGKRSLSFAKKLAVDMHGSLIVIPKEKKILYHGACIFASNYAMTMLGAAEQALSSVNMKYTLKHLKPLIESSIANALALGSGKALTGPIVRGSAGTIQKHIQALQTLDADLAEMYRQCGIVTVKILLKNKRMSFEQSDIIEAVLRNS